MSFRGWRAWISSLPWKYRWFVLLLLIRPAIDFTWNERFFFALNLLQVIGVLTPVIIIYLLITRQLSSTIASTSAVSRVFLVWGILIVFNAFLTYISNPSRATIDIALKMTFPIYIYLFLRHLIKSKDDLEGMLQTILYSAIVPAGLLLYEIFVSPFRVGIRSAGVERYMAGYADVVYLSVFVLLSLLIIGYFWLEQQTGSAGRKIRHYHLFMVIVLNFVCLLRINHVASFVTFGALLGLFIIFNIQFTSRGLLGAMAILFLMGAALIFFRPQNRVMNLVETDLSVMRGERSIDGALHGRVWAWKRHWNFFISESSPVERVFGLIGRKNPGLLGSGAHNDYLRIIYAAGLLGLAAYLFMLFLIIMRSRQMRKSQRFLLRGMLVIVLLMSISTTPTFYVNINYTFMTIVAFLVLPRSLRVPQIVKA